MLGALLTFGTTRLNECRQRRREAAQRKQWVVENLSAQLEFDRTAVSDGQETKFEAWRGKLLSEGYYAELEKLTERDSDLGELAQAILRAGFRLQDYEDRRLKSRLEPQFQQSLAQDLGKIIKGIKGLRIEE